MTVNIDNDCGVYGIDGLPLYDGGVLENAGSLSLTDNTIIASDGSAGAQVINDVGASISYDGSSSTAGAGISAPFPDKGAMNIGQGTLSLGGSANLAASASVIGPGTLAITGGNTTLESGVAFTGQPAVLVAGTLSVPSSFTLTGVSTFTLGNFGTLDGPGSLTLSAGTTSASNNCPIINDARLINRGSMTVNIDNDCGVYGIDGLPLYDGGVLENAGSLSLTDNTIIASDGSAGAQVINDVGASISYDGSSSTAGAGISAPFTDKGAMNIGQGTLSLGGSANLLLRRQ